VSLDAPLGDEGEESFKDFVADEQAASAFDHVASAQLSATIGALLATLAPREQAILRLRFGLGGGRPHTLEEIGKAFNLTRERVRQIELAALRKLQHPVRRRKLEAAAGRISPGRMQAA
jgi:RNA polymerase primary sigma factor